MELLRFTTKGIYCEQAGVYIDPVRRVDKALITHAHSDHAVAGHRHYLATQQTALLLRHRLGKKPLIQGIAYNYPLKINGVTVSFHPAGHVFGSAQIRLEYKGEVWVVSGDYKLINDRISEPFEPVKCHTFVTETTFGMPRFVWEPQETIFHRIYTWWQRNREEGRISVLMGYPLGKSQHLLAFLSEFGGNIYVHNETELINQIIRNAGAKLAAFSIYNKHSREEELSGALIIAPPSIRKSPWLYNLNNYSLAMVSGWISAKKRPQQTLFGDSGFALSDHADFPGLLQAVTSTGAERIITMHGYAAQFARSLNEMGFRAETALQ